MSAAAPQWVIWLLFLSLGATLSVLLRARTTLMGWSLLFLYSIGSASLSGFVFGRVFGLEESWVTPSHILVFEYSAWAILAMVLAIAAAWLPLLWRRRRANRIRIEDLPLRWVNPTFIYASVAFGAAATTGNVVFGRIATVGTVLGLCANWMKIGIVVAAIHWRLGRGRAPLLIALLVFVPFALATSVRSGFSPVTTDLAIPLVLAGVGFRKFGSTAIMKIGIAGVLLANLMFAWMESRGAIRKGEFDQFELQVRVQKLVEELERNLSWSNLSAFNMQSLIFERIDMSQMLALQTGHQPNIQPYRQGGTLLDGVFALVPRALWPSKPTVAGGYEFVSRYTGLRRGFGDETSIGVPVQLELYANGGPPWVIAGLALLAFLCARIERGIVVAEHSLPTLAASLMTLMAFGSGIEQIMIVATSIAAGAGSVFLLARLAERVAPAFVSRLMGESPRPVRARARAAAQDIVVAGR